jgi:antitoxin VapB
VSLNIKSEYTHQLVRELTHITHENQTTAVTIAVKERLNRLQRETQPDLVTRMLALGADIAPRLKEPFSSADHGDLLYDELGLPR